LSDKAECGNERMVRRVKASNYIGNKVFILYAFADCSKLVSQAFGSKKVVRTTLRSLIKSLKLPLEVENLCAGVWSKLVGEIGPNLAGCVHSIDGRNDSLSESSIDPSQYKLVFLLPN